MESKDKKTSQGIKPSNPCPFCGCLHTEILKPGQSTSGGYQVQCVNCGARGPTGWKCDQGAAQSWNNGDTGFNRPIVGGDSSCDTLDIITDRGITLWADGDGIAYSAPGGLTQGDASQIRAHKPALLRILRYCEDYHKRKLKDLDDEAKETPWELVRRLSCYDDIVFIDDHTSYLIHTCDERGEDKPKDLQGKVWVLTNDPREARRMLAETAPIYDGFVYFVEAVGLQRIKIGYSKDPEARLKSLQTGSPVPLVEIGRILGDQQSETDLHQQFDHLRLDGEWFHAAKQLRDYIRGLQ